MLTIALAAAGTGIAAEPAVSPEARAGFAAIGAHAGVRQALDFIRNDAANTLAEQKAMTAIPAPPFKESVRAENYRARLAALGLKNVRIDSEGNAIGVRPGSGGGPKLLVSAHLDTVFPEGTDVTVREKGGKLFAPGIADDTRGLAALLCVLRAFNAAAIRTVADIYFAGNVGEEGLGDLRGMKALFRDHKDIDGAVVIDGVDVDRIVYLATGSHRYRVSFKGPGGHSFSAFGLPSAIHAMGRAIAKIGELKTPKDPKTTFTVGTVSGGTSVNAIAGEAVMEIDMRSNDNAPLLAIEAGIMRAIKEAVAEENARWSSDKITADIKLVGDRPAGLQSADSPPVVTAHLAALAVGVQRLRMEAASTDSNLPISLGIPSVTIGGGGKSEGTHSLEESYDPTNAHLGPQRILLTVLALAGIEGVAKPILPKRTPR